MKVTKVNVARMAREQMITERDIVHALGMVDTESRKKAVSEVESIRTREEAQGVYYRVPAWSKEQRRAFAEWRKLSAEEVAAAATFDDAWNACQNAPLESPEREQAFLKCIGLAATPEEARKMYQFAFENRWFDLQKPAIRKIAKFYQQ